MKKISLRGILKKNGATNLELRWNGGPACRDYSGFFTGNGGIFKAGQEYYITYSKNGLYGLPNIMHREVKHRRDYTGGQNQWWLEREFEKQGYKVEQNDRTGGWRN